ncbi:hypothetical protein SAMCCGM7_pC2072 (plasmid) [Sinorhizobium americanum CCGM7]|uniref:hypothetical protein n=1 Tax=Sinorhizobium americanum TaxID=194963 RepID=UPI0004D6388D|nr:hypothetical protein [Sinorhizobium americanum]APG89248.1 hypothetical protein SAMCCGM7_pC2072 [Sinorhizobium americanum CCGM7]
MVRWIDDVAVVRAESVAMGPEIREKVIAGALALVERTAAANSALAAWFAEFAFGARPIFGCAR